jgi:hypothetical protein
MSTDTATEVATSAPEPATEVASGAVADEAAKPEQMFRYSGWVHVGPGADECEAINEDEGTSDCSDPRHFHAWCRLPNQFQHREIREKALAAKARKTRQLRDPETDGHAILEDAIDQLARQGDDALPLLIAELTGKDWWADYMQAAQDVQEREDGTDDDDEPVKPFARMEQDQRRYEELKALPEDERPADEFEELGRHLSKYAEAVKERQEELTTPKREALEERGVNALLDLVRDQRVNAAGTDEFMHVYSTWTMLVGTLKQPGGAPVWPTNPQALQVVAPEVVEAVQEMFDDLEQTQQRGLEGNG